MRVHRHAVQQRPDLFVVDLALVHFLRITNPLVLRETRPAHAIAERIVEEETVMEEPNAMAAHAHLARVGV